MAMANHSAPPRSPGRPAATRSRAARSSRTALSLWSIAGGTAALATLPVALAGPTADAAPDPSAKVLSLTNAQRAQHGCRPLARNATIDRAAQGYAVTMSRTDTFSHDGPDGSTFDERIRRAGYARPGGENIAQGQD